MATYSAQSKFCRPEEDPFLLLDRASRSIEQLLRRDLPLRRTWSEQPYGGPPEEGQTSCAAMDMSSFWR